MKDTIVAPKGFPTLEEIEQAKSLAPEMDPYSHYVLNILIRVSRNMEINLDRNMNDYGLTMGRYAVLAKIYQVGRKGIPSSKLADAMGVTRATMTGLLDNLERDGLVRRSRRTNDKRRIDVRVTNKAREKFRNLLPDHCARVRETFSVFSEEEMAQFSNLLFKLDGNLKHLTTRPDASDSSTSATEGSSHA
ncbi:MAG: MarR family transcriptional regulator [Pseudomonadota bacterium]